VYVSYVPENSIISILDLTGRVIKNKQAAKSENNVRLDLNLASGVYFIRIENNNVKTLQKLIIK
jgi:hypothetical protein